MKLVYIAVFYPYEDGYTVEFPDLPGCITQGRTLEESLEMACDAASGWILGEIEDGSDIPSPSKRININDFEGAEFYNYIALDINEYAKMYGEKAVKKTLTIPRWLNTLAEKNEINFSKVLQNALKEELDLDIGKTSDAKSDESITFINKEFIGKIDKIFDYVEANDKSTNLKITKRIQFPEQQYMEM